MSRAGKVDILDRIKGVLSESNTQRVEGETPDMPVEEQVKQFLSKKVTRANKISSMLGEGSRLDESRESDFVALIEQDYADNDAMLDLLGFELVKEDVEEDEEDEEPISENMAWGKITDADLEEMAVDIIDPSELRGFASQLNSVRSDNDVSKLLRQADKLLGGHGVEAVRSHDEYDRYFGDTVALYINMGDQYALTLWYDVYKGEFVVADWTTFMKDLEKRYDNLTQR